MIKGARHNHTTLYTTNHDLRPRVTVNNPHDRKTCTPVLLFARVKIVFLNIVRYHIGVYSM